MQEEVEKIECSTQIVNVEYFGKIRPFFKLKDLWAVCVIPMTIPRPRSYLHKTPPFLQKLRLNILQNGAPWEKLYLETKDFNSPWLLDNNQALKFFFRNKKTIPIVTSNDDIPGSLAEECRGVTLEHEGGSGGEVERERET